jgi:hypothetical protein
MRMSFNFREIYFFLAAGAQIPHLHASNWAQKVHPHATSAMRRRGTCIPRKRPEFDQTNRPRPLGWFHFAGSVKVLFDRASGRIGMKTHHRFGRGIVRPNR